MIHLTSQGLVSGEPSLSKMSVSCSAFVHVFAVRCLKKFRLVASPSILCHDFRSGQDFMEVLAPLAWSPPLWAGDPIMKGLFFGYNVEFRTEWKVFAGWQLVGDYVKRPWKCSGCLCHIKKVATRYKCQRNEKVKPLVTNVAKCPRKKNALKVKFDQMKFTWFTCSLTRSRG